MSASMASPSPNGFSAQAAADPGRTVLIAPDGEEWTAARLHAACNRLVHGLRAAGLERGDAFAVVLPNGVEFFTAHLAATQAGLYLVPVNHHLVGPEIAWIVADSGAKALIAHERFGDAARAAADEAGLPPEQRYAVGTVTGFRPYAALLEGQPETPPEDRTLGWDHELHLRHRRTPPRHAPPPVRPPARGVPPRRLPRHLRHPAVRRNVYLGVLAALPHGRAPVRGRFPAHGAPGRPDGQVDARGDAAADRHVPLHRYAHGAHPVPPAARPPGGGTGTLRRDLDAARHPRRRALPRPRRAGDDRLVGELRGGVLRGERGRRRVRHRRGLAQEARYGRPGLADQRTGGLRRRRQPAAARRTGHRLQDDTAASATTRTRTRPAGTASGTSSPSATSDTWTRTGISSSATARST
ncbi:hypothetical protein SRIMM317S_04033 [Streptomyces rimosus subsp. rimosus]